MRRSVTQPAALNSEQALAVNAGEGAYACLAGPGSGKTTVIVQRYLRLAQGSDPHDLLSLTFTKEAAAEMRKRAGIEKTGNGDGNRPSGFMTFHALALYFATQERESFPFTLAPFPLATEGVAGKFAGDAARKYKLKFRELLTWMSGQKRQGLRPEHLIEATATNTIEMNLAKAYGEYETRCRAEGVLDFDSLLIEMLALLVSDSQVNARWQYKWLQVDESQDADSIQWAIVQNLVRGYGNIFAVGDCNQCIYEWRSAHPELFLKFHEMFPLCKYLFLGMNYRSSPQIVNFCKEIAPIKNELIERFQSARETGDEPIILPFENQIEETAGVLDGLQRLHSTGDGIAILARTNRQLIPFQLALTEKSVPFHLLGNQNFWEQAEIKNTMAYVQLVEAPFDNALAAAIRAPFHPAKFIRKKELVDRLQGHAEESMWGVLRNYRDSDPQQERAISQFRDFVHGLRTYRDRPAQGAITGVLRDLRAFEYYGEEEQFADIDNNPVENLQELIRMAGRFLNLADLFAYVRRAQGAARSKKGVALATIHQSKGKEWENVFVVGAAEGVLPHAKGELAEEERIFFVACSRAAKRLFITYSGTPSRFIQKYIGGNGNGGVREANTEAICPRLFLQ